MTSHEALTALADQLKSDDSQTRMQAAGQLAVLDSDDDTVKLRVIQTLLIANKSQDAALRRKTAEVLGAMQDRRALDPLLAATKFADPEGREGAALALGFLARDAVDPREFRRAVRPLVALLAENETAYVRAAAAWALGALNDARAVDVLTVASTDSDPQVSAAAQAALSALQGTQAQS